jgi:hypothetical protein
MNPLIVGSVLSRLVGFLLTGHPVTAKLIILLDPGGRELSRYMNVLQLHSVRVSEEHRVVTRDIGYSCGLQVKLS